MCSRERELISAFERAILLKEDCRLFQSLVDNAIDFLKLDNADIAEHFGASVSTIERWRKGTSAPHPAIRTPIYKAFIKFLEEADKVKSCATT